MSTMSNDIASEVKSRRESSQKKVDVIDVQVEEAKKLAALQIEINRRYAGADKDLKVWMNLRDELIARCAEIGFVVDVSLKNDMNGNWYPECSIVGRVDTHLQEILNAEGPDIERKAWNAKRESSSDLIAQGVNVDLL